MYFLEVKYAEIEQQKVTTAASSNPSYAQAVAGPVDYERLDKLEFVASESERNRRILDVTITHPSIDNKCPDLLEHT